MQLREMIAGRRRAAHTSARALGWFSIGLGIAEVVAPSLLGRLIGLPGREPALRAYGAREIATGIGILNSEDPTPWVWGRVAGDAMDLASLGAGLRNSSSALCTLGAVGAVIGVALADLATARVLEELRQKDRTPYPDYSTRSGFPNSPDAMRGIAAPQQAQAALTSPRSSVAVTP
jgi:hypothetical protein